MANFSNFSKVQLLVSRQQGLGSDNAPGGTTVSSLLSISGVAVSGSTFDLLGYSITTDFNDIDSDIAIKVDDFISAENTVGLTLSRSGSTILFTWDEATFIGTIPSLDPAIVVEDGVLYDFSNFADTRDAPRLVMKHSEYEDSQAGMDAATATMYALILDSPPTDTVQLQRLRLDDSSFQLVKTNITEALPGELYPEYISP